MTGVHVAAGTGGKTPKANALCQRTMAVAFSHMLLFLVQSHAWTAAEPRAQNPSLQTVDQDSLSGTPTGSRSLCYGGPEDLERDIAGSVEFGPLPPGDRFPEERMEDFPYASKLHCPTYNQSLQLVPDNCRLDVFQPELFLQQFKGRRLIFWGDSVMRQHFAYLILRLER